MKRFALLVLAVLAMAPAAQAQLNAPSPYTLTVPLRLANVPETTSVRVSCIVSHLGVGATGGAAEENLVARGDTMVTVTGGAYNGDVTVPTVFRGGAALRAVSYSCTFTLMGPTAGGGTFAAPTQESYTRVTGRPITSSTPQATGTMP